MRSGIALSLLTVCSLARPAHADTPATNSLASTLDAFSTFTLAEGAQHMKGSLMKIESLEISIVEGSATPVRAKDGSVIGLYFEGSGGWTYRPSTPGERAVLKTNTDRVARGLRASPDAVADYFKQMIVIFSEPLWTKEWDPAAGAAAAPEAPPAGAAKTFDDALHLIRSSIPELDFRLTQTRMNKSGRFAYVEFIGGAERVGYRIDEVGRHNERIFSFRKFGDYSARFTQTISEHDSTEPAGDTWVSATIKHADFQISTSDNKRGTIDTDLDLRLAGPKDARVVAFDLTNSQDPDSTEWTSKINKLETKRVLDGEGHALPFAHRYDMILIEIPPLATGSADMKLRVETEGELFTDWKGHHGDSFFALKGAWYPRPEESRGYGSFTFTTKIRVKKPWVPISSGTQFAESEGDDWMEASSRSDKPARMIQVLGGKYVTREETIDGRKIRVHAYAMARKNVLDNMPKLAGAIIGFYSGILGPMDSDELDIVEVPEYGFGIAPYGMVLLTTEAWKPHEEVANWFVRGINARLAHEIAHQWWGHKAFPLRDDDDWISESLAEYWSGLAMGAMAGDKPGVQGFPDMLAGWRGEAPNCESTAPISGVSSLGGENSFRDRYCLLYHRGPLVIHMLRTLVGNERFNAACKAFLDRSRGVPVSADDFAKAFTDTVHNDLSWVVEDWIRKAGTPDIKVDYKLAGSGITGTVTESGNGGFKRLLVPLILDYGGQNQVMLVYVDKPVVSFERVLTGKPRDVKVDPARNNLAKYH